MGDFEQAVNQPKRVGSPDGEPTPRTESARASAREGNGGARPGGHGSAAAHENADEAALEGDVGELMTVAAQRDEYLALAQRTQADFENYRKRVARESSAAFEKGTAKLVKELLPALDSLDKALEGAAQDDPLLEGVRLVRSEVRAALERSGVESYSPVGEQFDPSQHEAIAQHPSAQVPSGAVLEVYQAGYRMGDHIIRPARVVVAA